MNRLFIQRLALFSSDFCCLGLAFLSSIYLTKLYHPDLAADPWSNFFHFGLSKILGLVILLVFAYYAQYTKRRPFWEELRQTYRLILLFMIINLGVAFTMGKGSLKVMLVSTWVLFALFLPLGRSLTKRLLLHFGIWQRRLFILGTGATALDAFSLFAQNKLMGYQLEAFVADFSTNEENQSQPLPRPVISRHDLIEATALNSYCDIIIALEHQELNQSLRLINYLQHKCINLLVLPPISGLPLFGADIEHFFGNDQLVLSLNNNLAASGARLLKRGFDLVCVSLGLILLAPFFVAIAIVIKVTTRSAVFYFHQRVGRNGKPFYCIKFQTMYPNSQELLQELLARDPVAKLEWETGFKLKNDPRVTWIGAWLRKTSLDELPQLFNVLKGDMSLVGPRPIISAEIERYLDGFYYYQLVLPGITGLWQVSGRSDTDYSLRVRLDEWYVKNWSLWYDIVILIKTVGVVLSRSGAY